MARSRWSIHARRKARDRVFDRYAEQVRRNPDAYTPLRRARVEAGVTAAELGQAASLTLEAVARIERGQSRGSRHSRQRIAKALDREPGELFGEAA